MTYNETFYDTIRQGCLDSALTVVPRVIELVQPKTVVDFGCGEGVWLSVFKDLGCAVKGVDGDYVERSRLAIAESEFIGADLRQRHALGKHDLVVSLEVAEHLPGTDADPFVDMLTRHGDVVLFSAAIPGQGGTGHINEQWPDYWVEKFKQKGYVATGALRWEFWTNEQVENWYRQNLILFAKPEAVTDKLSPIFDHPLSEVIPVVHPVLWNARR